MKGTGEREAEVVGYRPEVKEEYYWWTCNDQLSCSGQGHEGSWDEPVAQVSWGS